MTFALVRIDFTSRMLLRRSIGASTPAAACSRPLRAHRCRANGPLCRLKRVAPGPSARMGADEGGRGEEKGEGKGLVDQAAASAAAAAAPAAAAPSGRTSEDPSALLDTLASFKGFVVEEVLHVNDINKVAAVVGRYERERAELLGEVG